MSAKDLLLTENLLNVGELPTNVNTSARNYSFFNSLGINEDGA